MAINVHATDDAARVLTDARGFLASRPAEHNVVLTLLTQRAADPQAGRYWVAHDGDDVVGVAFLSPLDFFTSITPTAAEAVDGLVDAMSCDVPDLLGVIGDVSSAARFAGEWAARRHVGVVPEEGQRLYRLATVDAPHGVPGALRLARDDEVDLLVEWNAGFAADTGDPSDSDTKPSWARTVAERRAFVWDDGRPRSMAALSPVVADTARVQHVYTPPDQRRRGYAAACVAALSTHALAHGAGTVVL